jgi:hypothetical protein
VFLKKEQLQKVTSSNSGFQILQDFFHQSSLHLQVRVFRL